MARFCFTHFPAALILFLFMTTASVIAEEVRSTLDTVELTSLSDNELVVQTVSTDSFPDLSAETLLIPEGKQGPLGDNNARVIHSFDPTGKLNRQWGEIRDIPAPVSPSMPTYGVQPPPQHALDWYNARNPVPITR
jgi:hypothetical protein